MTDTSLREPLPIDTPTPPVTPRARRRRPPVQRGRLASAAVRVGRSIAALLPPPRDEALIALGRDLYRLLTGAGGRRRNRSAVGADASAGSWRDAVSWRAARKAFEQRDYEEALTRVGEVLAGSPDSVTALRLKRDVHTRRGDLTEGLATVRRLAMVDNDPRIAEQERMWLGRLIETDPRWRPRIPGPPRPIEPVGDDVVMHLLKESLPYQQNGFTMRSRYTLLAQAHAGIKPFVVTSLGFPRKDGHVEVPLVEEVDGIRHHRLDLGPGYRAEQPFDVNLTDYAWMASDVAVAERPAIIHASSGFRGFETALVGLALRDHLRLPLLYEVRSFFETTWSADDARAELGEHYRRRFATESRAMQAADAVITIADAMRDDIAARGVPAERIHLMPNGVDPSAFEPMEPDPELCRRYRLDGKIVIGYVSNLDHPREGQEFLIDATAKLAARGRDVVCLIVGDGRRREELERHARSSGASPSIIFTGRVPHAEVRAHYSLFDVFVVPRRNDRAARHVTPLKPFEAMAMGKPLVVSQLPALVEIAAPGARGLAFPAEDADGLAAAVETLIDHPELRAAYGAAGRAWVLSERTWDRNGQRYREIYAEVLERWRAHQRRVDAA